MQLLLRRAEQELGSHLVNEICRLLLDCKVLEEKFLHKIRYKIYLRITKHRKYYMYIYLQFKTNNYLAIPLLFQVSSKFAFGAVYLFWDFT